MSTLKGQLQTFTASLSLRERRALTLAFFSVILALTWVVLVAPAWQQLRQAPKVHQTLDAQLQKMRSQAQEATQLRSDTAASQTDAAKIIQEATKTHLGPSSQATVSGERVTVTLVAVSASGLAQWLAAVRQNAHTKPVEAHLTKSGNEWAGTLYLALPARPSTP